MENRVYYEGGGYMVTWCIGHLLGLAEPQAYDEKYAKWRYSDLPILPNEWLYTANKNTKKQLDILLNLMLTVSSNVREGFTKPPKHYNEDLLLSAMETSGAEDRPDDAERKGLGTPATRAAIIENLIKAELLIRKEKNLLPTD